MADNPDEIIPVNPEITRYLNTLASARDHPVLKRMEALAQENGFPIVGRLSGMFLQSMATLVNARRVFEFGSGFGYSAYWFARATGNDAAIICTDADAANRSQAETFLQQAGLWEPVDFRVGIAQDIFRTTEGLFDVCYNDVDKGDYPLIWRLTRDKIRPGGLYIADNVLWHGRVAQPDPIDIVPGWTEAIREHNQTIFADPEFDTFINPTRDGILVARRKTG